MRLLGLAAMMGLTAAAPQMREISERDLRSKIQGYWVGQLVGNFMGLPFEFAYYDTPMPIEPQMIYNTSMADAEGLLINRYDDRCCVPETLARLEGAYTDDDTDIEYVTSYALEEHGLSLSREQMQEYWIKAINIISERTGWQTIWVANLVARSNMDTGLVPPATGLKKHNNYWWAIDPQLVNEIWSAVYPGMVSEAVERADWGARITSEDWGVHPTVFYAALYSAAFFETDVATLYDIAMSYIPTDSPFYDALVDVKEMHADPNTGWRDDWWPLREKYLRYPEYCNPEERYDCGVSSMINGVMGAMAFLYGEGDFLKTQGIALAAAYDNDNQAATLGGLLAVMHGVESIPRNLTHTVMGFPHVQWDEPFNDIYTNERRPPLPYMNSNLDISERVMASAEQAILENGGSVRGPAGDRTFTVPYDTEPKPPTLPPAPDYYVYAKRNSYAGHGGTPLDVNDDPAGVGVSSDACMEYCDARSDCDCVTYLPGSGQCWLRSTCLVPEFESGESADEYYVFVKPVSTLYTEYVNANAYPGHGGVPIDPEDEPVVSGISAEHCKMYCEADERCTCVAWQQYSNNVQGGCWLRSSCDPSQFEFGYGSGNQVGAFNVYVQE